MITGRGTHRLKVADRPKRSAVVERLVTPDLRAEEVLASRRAAANRERYLACSSHRRGVPLAP